MFAPTARRAALVWGAAAAGVAALLAAPSAVAAPNAPSVLDRVPADFAPWIHAAPLACAAPQITPGFVAAQLEFESGFDARAVGPGGQLGPAQLLPHQVAEYVHDDNGNGTASPFEIGDAVAALVRLDCRLVDQLAAAGKPTDVETVAAAYVAGPTGVDLPVAREYARAVVAAM